MSSKSPKHDRFRKIFKETGHAVRGLLQSRSLVSSSSSSAHPTETHGSTPIPTAPATAGLPKIPIDQLPQPADDVGQGPMSLATQPPVPTPTAPGPSVTYVTGPSRLPSLHQNRPAGYHLPYVAPAHPVQGVPSQNPSADLVAVPTFEPRQSVSTPPGDLRTKDIASAVLKTPFDALKKTMSVIPTFNSVADVLSDCMENVPVAAKNHKDYEDLVNKIEASRMELGEHLSKFNPAQMTKGVANVIEQLNHLVKHIIEKQKRTKARAYVDAEQDIDDLIQCYRKVEELFRQLQSEAVLNVWRITSENWSMTNETLVNTRLSGLNPVKLARYDSIAASQLRRNGCTPNTRQHILEELQSWTNDPYGAKVYWMNGMAGTGKTTIAHSLCHILKAAHQLAASFFCSRILPDCQVVARIVPTIAYQLARSYPPFQGALCRILSEDPDIGVCDVKTQFERLVHDPLLEIKNSLPAGLLVIVIDALDECSDREDAQSILEVLLRFAKDLPVKFFITCRPDRNLLEQVSTPGETSRSLFHLHNIEESLVKADIETYLWFELGRIHVPADTIKVLAERSGKLFIYAATVVRYIRAATVNIQDRISNLLGTESTADSRAYGPLDALYTRILSTVLEDEELEPFERTSIELLLHTIICAREPLSVESLAHLLQLQSSNEARQAIEPLRSLLHVDERTGLVSPLHASFPDFMFIATRSGRFFCDQTRHNERLAQLCFGMMKKLLRFNICDLESSFVLDEEVPDLPTRIANSVPPHLFYVCRYWSDHLILSANANSLLLNLRKFFCQMFLFWMEVMNLKQSTKVGTTMLSASYRWMKSNSVSDDLCLICQDAQKFITIVGGNAVCKSTPHIYVSVLALWDKADPIWVHYGTRMRGLVQAKGTAIEDRESALLAIWPSKNEIYCISVSHDGRHVASASLDKTVCVWDAHNGDMVIGPLKGHTGPINSVAFSPESDRIVSGSGDNTLRVWDTKNGYLLAGPFEGHTSSVRSVTFSPDGHCIASGADDYTIRIWDAQTGQNVVSPLSGHQRSIWSVTYSPDGARIASSSGDCTIRIWSLRGGDAAVNPLIIAGHTDDVRSVAFSQDGNCIASGSTDYTIRIWDSQTGGLLAGPLKGHTDAVFSVVYSPDSSQIISGSRDHTVRIWDVQTGLTVAGPLKGHTNCVYSAVFMPDGSRIISCSSDRAIRIWDSRTRLTQSHPREGHTGPVRSVAFSHDGSRIVSGSDDCTVCIWDVRTGVRVAGPFKGHTSIVTSVAFSPCCARVASASKDYTVRVWDADTGHMLVRPCEGHTDEVYSVAFSPDGRHIASGSGDRTVRVWDAQTGSTTVAPLTGHTKLVMSVAYSPTGDRIVSGSFDRTIRVWDARNGTVLAISPFKGHNEWIWSVGYSHDGRRIVSSSGDLTIRIWDAQTGDSILNPPILQTDLVRSVAYSTNNLCIVSGSRDRSVCIWDAEAGRALAGPFKAHTDWLQSVAFSPDDRLITSSSLDSAIRIWDLQKCMLTTSQNSNYWSVNEDGWVISHDSHRLLWLSSDLRTSLKWPQNVAVIHQSGSFELDFSEASIGSLWTECCMPE